MPPLCLTLEYKWTAEESYVSEEELQKNLKQSEKEEISRKAGTKRKLKITVF